MRQYNFTKLRNSVSSIHNCSSCGKKLEIGDTVISNTEDGNYRCE